MSDASSYASAPSKTSQVQEYMKQRPGQPLTTMEIEIALGCNRGQLNSTMYNLANSKKIPVTKVGTTPEGLARYAWPGTQRPAAEIKATPDGGMQLVVTDPPGPEDTREVEERLEDQQADEPKPIGPFLTIHGHPLPGGDLMTTDDQGTVWRATLMI